MSFSRFENMDSCTLEQKRLGHDDDSANKICGAIKERAEKGALLKASEEGLVLLSKAGSDDIVVGGYASWECEDDEGDYFTVEAQSKALTKFFNQPPEYRLITVNHGRGPAGEINIATPMLKYTDSKGTEFFSHVNEAGTFLISKLRADNMKAVQYYRKAAIAGNLNGYSVNAFPLAKEGKKVTDMEYSAITLTERGVAKPINPMTRDVKVISKAQDLVAINSEGKYVPLPDSKMDLPLELPEDKKAEVEAILQKYGFKRCI